MTTTNQPQKPTARSIGTATIHFGLVVVPVKVYSSHESSDDLSFHLHHDADGARLKQQHVCTVCGEVVDREHTVKGYEHAKGQHVLFSGAELEALEAVATNAIAIEEFVDAGELDPTFVEKTYYLGADKGSERAFQLVADVLDETGKVAMATYSRKGSERLVCVRAPEGALGLVLHELRFASEVKPHTAVGGTAIRTSAADMKLAKQLVERSTSAAWNPAKYRDGVKIRQMEMIQAKIDGGQIVMPPVVPAGGVVDLLAALRASLERAPARAATGRIVHRDRRARVRGVAHKAKARAGAKRPARAAAR